MEPISLCKGSDSARCPKEKDAEKVGAASEEVTIINSTVDKAVEITKDDAKTM